MATLGETLGGNGPDTVLSSIKEASDRFFEGSNDTPIEDIETSVIEHNDRNTMLYSMEVLTFFDYFYEVGMQFGVEYARQEFDDVIESISNEQNRFNLVF